MRRLRSVARLLSLFVCESTSSSSPCLHTRILFHGEPRLSAQWAQTRLAHSSTTGMDKSSGSEVIEVLEATLIEEDFVSTSVRMDADSNAKFTDVVRLDQYAKPKAANFVRRHGKKTGTTSLFESVPCSAEGTLLRGEVPSENPEDKSSKTNKPAQFVMSRIQLPLAAEYGIRYGEGIATSVKDAETLASMHATAILDSLGIQIYNLPSMQKKHADQVRAAGGWAPYPGDPLRPTSTPSPLPYRCLVASLDESEGGKFQLIDLSVDRQFQCPLYAMLSPAYLDPNSMQRVRNYFMFILGNDEREYQRRIIIKDNVPSSEGVPMHHVKLHVPDPSPGKEGDTLVIAQSKARERFRAIQLAHMHAELLLDALGVPIYPVADTQALHKLAATSLGREVKPQVVELRPPSDSKQNASGAENNDGSSKAANPQKSSSTQTTALVPKTTAGALLASILPSDPGVPGAPGRSIPSVTSTLPRPLKELLTQPGRKRQAAPSEEELLVQAHVNLHLLSDKPGGDIAKITDINTDAKSQLRQYLLTVHSSRAQEPFFVEQLPASHVSRKKYRATVVLPQPIETIAAPGSDREVEILTQDEDGTISGGGKSGTASSPTLGGIGFGNTVSDAETAAAIHALEVLNYASIPVFADPALQLAYVKQRQRSCKVVPGTVSPITPAPLALSLERAAPIQTVYPQPKVEIPKPPIPAVLPGGKIPLKVDGVVRPQTNTDYIIRRTGIPKTWWDLSADEGGRTILVEEGQQGASVGHTPYAIGSIRIVDPTALTRVGTYFANIGRRLPSLLNVTRVPIGRQNWLQIKIRMPFPQAYGQRFAIGTAPTQRIAELLAGMHAELLFDALGFPLFHEEVQQRQHAIGARQAGRFAPFPGEAPLSTTTASPPPLQLKVAAEKPAATIGGIPPPPAPPTKNLPSLRALQANYECLQFRDADTVSKARVQFFVKAHARLQSAIPSLVYETDPESGFLAATFSLPVPAKFGIRYAKGIGYSKKEAEVAVYIHAERVIDALGVQLFPLPGLQNRHVARVSKEGRWAPTFLANDVIASDKPSPKPVLVYREDQVSLSDDSLPTLNFEKTTRDAAVIAAQRHGAPVPPIDEADLDQWGMYVVQCKDYVSLANRKMADQFISEERVPRTGDPLIDATLDDVESVSVDSQAKPRLQNYCSRMNVSYPTEWRSSIVKVDSGKRGSDIRRTMTWVQVPGYEHLEAIGIGAGKDTSQRRAAMHVLALLKQVDPDFGTVDLDSPAMKGVMAGEAKAAGLSTAGSQRQVFIGKKPKGALDVGSYDRFTGSFTHEGKVRLVELFALCNGHPPPQLSHRQRHEGGRVVNVASVTLTMDLKRIVGRGENQGRLLNEQDAYNDLVAQLLRTMPSFRSLMHLVRTHPHLDPDHIVNLQLPKHIEEQIKGLVGKRTREEEEKRRASEKGEMVGQLPPETIDTLFQPTDEDFLNADDDDEENQVEKESSALFPPDGTTPSLETTVKPQSQKSQQEKLVDDDAHTDNILKAAALDRFNRYLEKQHARKGRNATYIEKFESRRTTLSIFSKRQEILDTVKNNRVTIISAGTGCGKTTQIPQYLLEDAIEQGKGAATKILVTQPRRISAMSIAQRVAAERLEPVGRSVGFTIRLHSNKGRCINFCTSGVLLRMFQEDSLKSLKYLVIDEIHERDINTDFLLILIKELLPKLPELRVLLMSATLQSDLFSKYFDGAPVISVEGTSYPIKDIHLEELAAIAKERKTRTWSFLQVEKGNVDVLLTKRPEDDLSPADLKSSTDAIIPKHGVLESKQAIDFSTIEYAIGHAATKEDLAGGSILVFLPGWDDIVRMRDRLCEHKLFHVLPLHSSISSEEQMEVFAPAPPEKIKVILSTNIAESGVTIDDVGCVIDSGRAKEMTVVMQRGRTAGTHQEFAAVSHLTTVLASKANITQRRGRAGRTRPGVCIRAYPKKQLEHLYDFQTPEILRVPLDSLCLQILSLDVGDAKKFLSKALEPPKESAVEQALTRLADLGAIAENGKLTPLGQRLAQLPVAPRVGKMILLGAALHCLDSVLTLAAMPPEPFNSSRDFRDQVKMAREEFSQMTLSDHLCGLNAFNAWVNCVRTKDPAEVVEYASERALMPQALQLINGYKYQFYEILCQSKFVVGQPHELGQLFVETSEYSENARNVALVKAVLCSALFPNVVVHRKKRIFRGKLHHTLSVGGHSVVSKIWTPGEVDTSGDNNLIGSDLEGNSDSPFYVYEDLNLVGGVETRIRNVSSVPFWGLILLGASTRTHIQCRDDLNLAILDGWIIFRVSSEALELIYQLKALLAQCVERTFVNPTDAENNQVLGQLREIVAELVSMPLQPNSLSESVWQENGEITPIVPPPSPPAEEAAAAGDGATLTKYPILDGEEEGDDTEEEHVQDGDGTFPTKSVPRKKKKKASSSSSSLDSQEEISEPKEEEEAVFNEPPLTD